LVIEGAAGRAGAPPATARSVPSLETEIERGWFFDGRTGERLNASVIRPAATAQGWRSRDRGDPARGARRPRAARLVDASGA
jgi:hypothetical protein